MSEALRQLEADVVDFLARLEERWSCEVKLTFIARVPGAPDEGLLITNDDHGSIAAELAVARDRAERKHDPKAAAVAELRAMLGDWV